MRVLFQIRPDYRKNPAGDTVQMLATGQGLKKLGVELYISTDPNVLLEGYDIVHIFNITRIKESYNYFLNAQKQKKKIVISPIYWNPRSFLENISSHSRSLASWEFTKPMRSRLVRECDLLLPNGEIELTEIKKDLIETSPACVIPNGFPDEFIGIDSSNFRKSHPYLPTEFVLSVARISPRKNQLWLARICQELGLPLVLIGPINDKAYAQQVRSFSNVIYLGVLQGIELASAYAAAKVHALPSWFETPGLSSLEASACGSVVLSTDQGSTPEYFKDLAVYVHPKNDESLRKGLEQALNWDPLPLTQHVRNNYPWSTIAQLTLNAYQSLSNET